MYRIKVICKQLGKLERGLTHFTGLLPHFQQCSRPIEPPHLNQLTFYKNSSQSICPSDQSINLDAVKKQLREAELLYDKDDVSACENLCKKIIAQFDDIKSEKMSQELKVLLSEVYYQCGLALKIGKRREALPFQNKALELNPDNKKAAKEKNLLVPKYPVIWPEPDYSYGETDPKYLKEMGLPEDYKPPYSK